jgi:hypothetical protein
LRHRLADHVAERRIGPAAWRPANLRWHGGRLRAVYGWDDLVCLPESILVV